MGVQESTRANAKKRIAALAVSAALACGLTPAVAFADGLAAGTVADDSTSQTSVQPQAVKKVQVYVLASSKTTVKGSGDFGGQTSTAKYTVNANGLLTKQATTSKMGGSSYTTTANRSFSYDKKNNIKAEKVSDGSRGQVTRTYKHNAAGVITSDTQKPAQNYGGYEQYSTKYTVKSGRVTEVKRAYKSGRDATQVKLYYQHGKVSAVKYLTYGTTDRYTYDKKGNVSTMTVQKGPNEVLIKHKNTYNKNGTVKKRVSTVNSSGGVPSTTTYKYKAVKVPKTLVKKVRAQQWALVNGNTNLALGTWVD